MTIFPRPKYMVCMLQPSEQARQVLFRLFALAWVGLFLSRPFALRQSINVSRLPDKSYPTATTFSSQRRRMQSSSIETARIGRRAPPVQQRRVSHDQSSASLANSLFLESSHSSNAAPQILLASTTPATPTSSTSAFRNIPKKQLNADTAACFHDRVESC